MSNELYPQDNKNPLESKDWRSKLATAIIVAPLLLLGAWAILEKFTGGN